MIILCGWKDIAKACGVKTRKTIKKKARRYEMPIVYMDGRPTITRKALERWWDSLLEKKTRI
jgi:hypothetical protein